MNCEPDAGGPGHLTPETLAELEELVRLRLGGGSASSGCRSATPVWS